MGRPKKNSHVLDTPDRIIDAALSAFAENGVSGAKLADIAKQADISRPSLLYHFASKDILYEAVVNRCFESLGQALGSVMAADGSFEQRLEGVVVAFEQYMASSPAVAGVLVRELLAGDGPGKALLLAQATPILDEVERWVLAEGKDVVVSGDQTRSILLHIVSNSLLRNASGDLEQSLWGPQTSCWIWVQTVVLGKHHA